MKYEMTVVIADPETPEGMSSDIVMKLIADFGYDPNQYGNGHSLGIKSEDGRFQQYYDIRYDMDFHKDNKIGYLEQWARNYWNGENGAYVVKRLSITEVE